MVRSLLHITHMDAASLRYLLIVCPESVYLATWLLITTRSKAYITYVQFKNDVVQISKKAVSCGNCFTTIANHFNILFKFFVKC